MLNKEEILKRLKGVIYPGFEKSIVDFGFVKSVKEGDPIEVDVEIVSSNPEMVKELKEDIKRVLTPHVAIIRIAQPKIPDEKSNSVSGKNIAPQIKNFIMVSSGKGGVGKSTTTLNLAISMAKLGKKVGILDADIYGPNIPRMLGETQTQPQVIGNKLKPILSHGVEMMSMGVLMEEGASLIWRGSMIMKAIEQLLKDVLWSELDILFLDMPPGTGDAQLTLAQSVPVTAGVCVTTPQVVALDDSKRGLDMFEKLHIPIAGIVENMSGFICPDNGKEYDIFGKGTTEAIAKDYNTQILAEIPIEPAVRVGGDSGKPISFYQSESITAKRYEEAAKKLWEEIEKINNDGGADNSAIQPVMDGQSACSK
ncbi:P-loop NTPase [Campylobacter sp. RM9344]|uniref:Iron-sulfur cluster carrier protein n=1 Tax=Campylobacter californiensis TaxID=1032243 RepID=A0AAW3ZYR5_9BACT|nr:MULTISPECIES: Mrp/NBP35 family ATP-binding protein [unclassified Campylobacter]MBE2984866.1 P-loop NTPase [Campylobacter sp. RM6883]MBE2995358.1 P-loop NTPase [Campylobacter sp. RM6913]MBE3029307.1 P-loop NTPase [Campylobacter sp. RM9344]MBE3608560.1 P-loop NTPase [Campylobacter sp. RM9337]QCD51149.1 ATP/GTP-binding protein [Campylobacter sp. RM6914]